MKKTLIILGMLTVVLVGCQQFKTGDGGMLYKIHTDAAGPTIKPGDFVALKAIYKTDADSIMFSSEWFDQINPLQAAAPTYKGDFNTGLALLSEGDSATIKINLDTMNAIAKRSGGTPPPLKGKYVIYVVKIVKVIPKDTVNVSAFNSKVEAFYKSEMDRAKSTEDGKIKHYIASKNLKPTVTASGLNYIVNKLGTGAKIVKGDSVQMNYTVSLLSGKVFDTSLPARSKEATTYNVQRPYEPIVLPYGGTQPAIAGVEEAMGLFPVGTSVTLILPSKLAYGSQGGGIPPYTPLIFEMEILKTIPGKPVTAPPVASLPVAK